MGGVLFFVSIFIIKIKINSSCEIGYIVETHLCKLCVVFRSRVLRVVCHQGYSSATPLATTGSIAIRVNRVMLVSLCAETIEPVSEGDKI